MGAVFEADMNFDLPISKVHGTHTMNSMSRILFTVMTLCLSITSSQVVAAPVVGFPAWVQNACRPDAMRLCHDVLRDTAKRQACMRAHRYEWSQACREAIRKFQGNVGPLNGVRR
jgi:hypothetical protein